MKKPRKLTITVADVAALTDPGLDSDEVFDATYAPPQESPVVKHAIEFLNTLCKKYRYAVLKDHEVIDDDSMTFSVDYHFNGREVGAVSFELDRQANGAWVARCYLSVKRGARLPMTNVTSFISDFKAFTHNLHIQMGESMGTVH